MDRADHQPDGALANTYFATGRAVDAERVRLVRLAQDYDPFTQAWLNAVAPLHAGARVIEAGSGAGSMLAWFATRVGARGDVLGLDMELRHAPTPSSPIRLVRGDVGAPAQEPGSFDLAYARLLFEHLSDPDAALARFTGWLKPGGRLAVIALDCSTTGAASGQGEAGAEFDAAVKTVVKAIARSGLVDPVYGLKLADRMRDLGLDAVRTARFDRVIEGGSPWALFLADNNLAIAEQLGVREPARLVARAMARPGFLFHDQALVAATGVTAKAQ